MAFHVGLGVVVHVALGVRIFARLQLGVVRPLRVGSLGVGAFALGTLALWGFGFGGLGFGAFAPGRLRFGVMPGVLRMGLGAALVGAGVAGLVLVRAFGMRLCGLAAFVALQPPVVFRILDFALVAARVLGRHDNQPSCRNRRGRSPHPERRLPSRPQAGSRAGSSVSDGLTGGSRLRVAAQAEVELTVRIRLVESRRLPGGATVPAVAGRSAARP